MASKAHRFNGDTPLTHFHGGTAAAARHAIKLAKEERHQAAREAARQIIARNLTAFERRDRLRPRVARVYADCGTSHWPPPTEPNDPRGPYREPEPALPHATLVWDRCGGTNRLDNLVGACRRCNGDKGSLTREEYEAVLAVRRQQECEK